MENIIITGLLIIITVLVCIYLYRAKKKGMKCIGCIGCCSNCSQSCSCSKEN
ncbi:MAG: hypothetical protein ACI4JN_12280 [Ruminococcus sp.]